MQHHYEPGAVIATVDALNGNGQLDREEETLKQVLVADRLVVTKADVAERSAVDDLEERLRGLNPAADLLEASFGEADPALLLAPGNLDPRRLRLPAEPLHPDVHPFVLFLDRPVDWTAFGIWLTMLLGSRGADVLRVKGLLNVGAPGPVVLNGVQHVVHPPEHLDAWPDEDHRSRIVFIARGIGKREVEESLAAFDAAARGGPSFRSDSRRTAPPRAGAEPARAWARGSWARARSARPARARGVPSCSRQSAGVPATAQSATISSGTSAAWEAPGCEMPAVVVGGPDLLGGLALHRSQLGGTGDGGASARRRP